MPNLLDSISRGRKSQDSFYKRNGKRAEKNEGDNSY